MFFLPFILFTFFSFLLYLVFFFKGGDFPQALKKPLEDVSESVQNDKALILVLLLTIVALFSFSVYEFYTLVDLSYSLLEKIGHLKRVVLINQTLLTKPTPFIRLAHDAIELNFSCEKQIYKEFLFFLDEILNLNSFQKKVVDLILYYHNVPDANLYQEVRCIADAQGFKTDIYDLMTTQENFFRSK
eukprot:TRINITY_DN2416_c0_g1_i2.p1 TRINITY_DN2416_c0_g1~~TRINITY_DN2416_c0_g1_i2.p1  ORF type:complete len:187 (+),score=0.41 TRINITY_DN2416_c0_g1_i2:429-989(+)